MKKNKRSIEDSHHSISAEAPTLAKSMRDKRIDKLDAAPSNGVIGALLLPELADPGAPPVGAAA